MQFITSALFLGLTSAGGFRYGTLSWQQYGQNEVEFNLVTAWRRSIAWPVHEDQPFGQHSDDGLPGPGDKLRITGLDAEASPTTERFPVEATGADKYGDHAAKTSLADRLGNRQENYPNPSLGNDGTYKNTGSALFDFGDGEYTYIDCDVTAVSASEDWLICEANIRHKYPGPWKSRTRKYLNDDGTVIKYEAGDPDSTQGPTGPRSEVPLGSQPAWDANYPKQANLEILSSDFDGPHKVWRAKHSNGFDGHDGDDHSPGSVSGAGMCNTRGFIQYSGFTAYKNDIASCAPYSGAHCCTGNEAHNILHGDNCPHRFGECERVMQQFMCAVACQPDFPEVGGQPSICQSAVEEIYYHCEDQYIDVGDTVATSGRPDLGQGDDSGCRTLRAQFGYAGGMASFLKEQGFAINSGAECGLAVHADSRTWLTKSDGLATKTNPTRRVYPMGLDEHNYWTKGGGATIPEGRLSHDDDPMLQTNQPYTYEPWTATFAGCCKIRSLHNNADHPYKLDAVMLLSEAKASPVIRNLPVVTVPQGDAEATFQLPANGDFLGRSGMDERWGPEGYSVATSGLTYTLASGPADAAVSNAGVVAFPTTGSTPGYYNMIVHVGTATATSTVDFMVRVVPNSGEGINSCPTLTAPPPATMDCYPGFDCEFSLGANDVDSNDSLVFNYAFASLGVYSTHFDEGENDNSSDLGHVHNVGTGLPSGATFFTVGDGNYITDVTVTKGNPFQAHRPLHDTTFAKQQMDLTHDGGELGQAYPLGQNWMNSEDAAEAAGFVKIDQDLNEGKGGARVWIWTKSATGVPSITDVRITRSADCADAEFVDEADLARRDGFTLASDVSFNAEVMESNCQMHLWSKTGSGPAVTALHVLATPDDANVPAHTHVVGDGINMNQGVNAAADGAGAKYLYVTVKAQNPISRHFHWSPCFHDAGLYSFCFEASDNGSTDGAPALHAEARCSTTQQCIIINVHHEPAPTFTSPLGEQSSYTAPMGGSFKFDVCANDANSKDSVSIGMHKMPGTDSELQPFRGAHEPQKYDLNFRLSTKDGGFAYGASMGDQFLKSDESNEACRTFHWVPTPYQGGWSGEVCFSASDSTEAFADHPNNIMSHVDGCRKSDVSTLCVTMNVQKCLWEVQVEDSLVEIAPRFGTNWLQLWYLNPEMPHPDYDLTYGKQGTAVHVGHKYTVEWHDTLYEMAHRFGTTVEHILQLNADISSDDGLKEGMEICIMPNSCHTADNVQRLWLGPDTAPVMP